MMGFTVVSEKVLSDADKTQALDLDLEFLEELSDDRVPSLLTWIDPTTRQSPEVVTHESVQQEVVALANDCSRTVVKPMLADPEGDHAA